MRTVLGHEFSGVITAIGKDIQDFEVSDEVYAMNDWFADGATAERPLGSYCSVATSTNLYGHRGLRNRNPQLEQFSVMRGAPHNGFA
jgi:Zn-dependent alcohol dehydrogenase